MLMQTLQLEKIIPWTSISIIIIALNQPRDGSKSSADGDACHESRPWESVTSPSSVESIGAEAPHLPHLGLLGVASAEPRTAACHEA